MSWPTILNAVGPVVSPVEEVWLSFPLIFGSSGGGVELRTDLFSSSVSPLLATSAPSSPVGMG
ncbi:MAG: hypothetical protein MJE68_25395 [Proteobacteria bacterium]|nr:hypothetical protein [Pseudomonadota bacterium]